MYHCVLCRESCKRNSKVQYECPSKLQLEMSTWLKLDTNKTSTPSYGNRSHLSHRSLDYFYHLPDCGPPAWENFCKIKTNSHGCGYHVFWSMGKPRGPVTITNRQVSEVSNPQNSYMWNPALKFFSCRHASTIWGQTRQVSNGISIRRACQRCSFTSQILRGENIGLTLKEIISRLKSPLTNSELRKDRHVSSPHFPFVPHASVTFNLCHYHQAGQVGWRDDHICRCYWRF